MSLQPKQMLLHYRMVEKIGQGGMGVVWKALDTTLDREVAIKILPDTSAADSSRQARFQREARLLASLNHPGIASIYSLHEAQGVRFLAMELVDGEMLSRRLGPGGLSLEHLLNLALPLTDAVALAHQRGITHRDLKPENVMFTRDGRVKVLDFGLAKLVLDAEQPESTQAVTASIATGKGRILGSVPYMSPEQAEGRPVDARSDVFSLGIMLYEMATGKRPFDGSTSISTLTAILRDEPPGIRSFQQAHPKELEAVVARCLEKDPQHRFKDAGELNEALQGLRALSGSETRPGKRLGAGLVVTMVLAVLAVYMWWPSAREEQRPTLPEAATSKSTGPSIAVLPFADDNAAPGQEYFSNGLTEDIITELSRYRELSVFSRTATAQYTNRDVDIRRLGEVLGARYLLQGSIRRSGERIRVKVELSDALDGRSIWGETYNRDLTVQDLFEMQDELTVQVVNNIAGFYGTVARAEIPGARRKPPASLDSYHCVLRVYEYLQVHTTGNHLLARECLESVVKNEPDYADGLAWLSYLYSEEYHHRRNQRAEDHDPRDKALAMAEAALALDTSSQVAHGVMALTYFFRGEIERARFEARRTIDLNPNNALWLLLMGTYLVQHQDFDEGLSMVSRSIALTPHPPLWMGIAQFHSDYHQGRYEDALTVVARMGLDDDFRRPLFLAATLGQLGRREEAGEALVELGQLWERPLLELREELIDRHSISAAIVDHLIQGLEKAGLHEQQDS